MSSTLNRCSFQVSLVETLVNDDILPKPMSRSHDPYGELTVSKEITWRVKRISNLEALKVLKFLLTKVVQEEEPLTMRETFVCFEYADFLESQKDRSFLAKYGQETDLCIRFFDFLRKNPDASKIDVSAVLRTLNFSLGRRFLYSPHAYYGLKNNSFKPLKTLVKTNRSRRGNLPEQRYVGVGYKDKGNKRIPHFDGSPSWQEVATSTVKKLTVDLHKLDWSKFFFRKRS